jgi:hypothetical protein
MPLMFGFKRLYLEYRMTGRCALPQSLLCQVHIVNITGMRETVKISDYEYSRWRRIVTLTVVAPVQQEPGQTIRYRLWPEREPA